MFKNIPVIGLVAMLAGTACAEPSIVIGDSITAAEGSWAELMRAEGTRVRVLAQNGRAIERYDIPRDLKADGNYKRAIYFLGTNDAIERAPYERSRTFFRKHMLDLRDGGFRVTVLIPGDYPTVSGEIRRMLIRQCDMIPKINCIDLQEIWPTIETYDSVHPTKNGQLQLWDFIKRNL